MRGSSSRGASSTSSASSWPWPRDHKIVVEGVNILKRHSKAGQSRGGRAPGTLRGAR